MVTATNIDALYKSAASGNYPQVGNSDLNTLYAAAGGSSASPPPGYPAGATQGPNGQWYYGGALLLDQGPGKAPIVSPTNASDGLPTSTQAGWTPGAGYVPYGPSNLVNPLASGNQAAPQNYNDLFSKLVPIVIGGAAAAATGGALSPLLAGVGAGVANAAGAGTVLGEGLGSAAAGAVGGAGAGAVGSAVSSGINGTPTTLGSVGKGAALGALGGSLSSLASPVTQNLVSNGVPQPLASGLVRTGSSALTGAAGAGLNGGNVLQGAASGAEHGAINAANGAVTGSILSGLGTVFNSGSTDVQTNNPSLTTPAAPTNTNMSTPNPFIYSGDDPTVSDYTPFDPNNTSFDPSQGGNSAPSTDPELAGFTGASGGLQPYSPGYLNNSNVGLDASSGGSSASSGLGGLLRALFGGSSGGQTGGSSSLLSALLGGALNTGAGVLNSQAAKGAANQFANQTQYNPYSVNTSNGSAGFSGTNAFSNLSPAAQANNNSLNGLVQSSANSLQQGPQASAQNYYNQLQASQSDANNKYYQNNLDDQFGKGILSSTAGQYQSQAALNNISQQGLNDQVLANNFANTQQQQQLAQLTGGLNGLSNSNSQQLAQLGLGGNLGSAAGANNLQAYKPQAVANANSTFGGVLSSLGSQNTTNGIGSLLGSLFGNQQTGP